MTRTLARRTTLASGAFALATVAAMLLASPASAGSNRDSDRDGMPDSWEISHHLSPHVSNALADSDHDGLTNIQEYVLHTNPRSADSDKDGISDGLEDSDHDGIDNEDDFDELCSVVPASTSLTSFSDDEDYQGQDCGDLEDAEFED